MRIEIHNKLCMCGYCLDGVGYKFMSPLRGWTMFILPVFWWVIFVRLFWRGV